jgi:hypothetical protein
MQNRLMRFLIVVVAGLVCEYATAAICRHRLLDVGESLLAAPFLPLALLWARFPTSLALLISAPVTFAAVAWLYCRLDLSHDPQGGVALFFLSCAIASLSAVLFAFGLAARSPRT